MVWPVVVRYSMSRSDVANFGFVRRSSQTGAPWSTRRRCAAAGCCADLRVPIASETTAVAIRIATPIRFGKRREPGDCRPGASDTPISPCFGPTNRAQETAGVRRLRQMLCRPTCHWCNRPLESGVEASAFEPTTIPPLTSNRPESPSPRGSSFREPSKSKLAACSRVRDRRCAAHRGRGDVQQEAGADEDEERLEIRHAAIVAVRNYGEERAKSGAGPDGGTD